MGTYMMMKKAALCAVGGGIALSLTACLGSSGDNGTNGPPGGGQGELPEYAVAGSLQGLGPGELVLDFNGEEVVLDADGEFSFTDGITEGTDYQISVVEQPELPYQHCSVTPDSGEVTGDIDVTVSCVTPIDLAGKLTITDPEDRDVTLDVGDRTFSTTTDSDGAYRIQAELENPWALMRLDMSEGESHFRSHIGSIVGLTAREALPVVEDHNRVSEIETGRVNLNHLNTAISGQMEWLNEGAGFADHEALVHVARALRTDDAASIAGALRMVTEGDESLPAWADTTLSVAVDVPAARQWLEGLKQGSSSQTVEIGQYENLDPVASSTSSTLEDNTSKALNEASVESDGFASLPESMFVTSGHAYDQVDYAAKLDFLAGHVWMSAATGDPARGVFNYVDGELHMNFEAFDEPYASATYDCVLTDSGETWRNVAYRDWYYQDVKVRRVMDGLSGDFVVSEQTSLVTYPDHPEECEPQSDHTHTIERFVSLTAPGDHIAMDSEALTGELAISLPSKAFGGTSPRASDIVTLVSGGSGFLHHYDLPIVWEVRSDGQLQIRPTGGDEIYQAWMISGSSDGEGHVLVDSAHSNRGGISADIAMRRHEDFFFNRAALSGRWQLWKDEYDENGNEPFILDYDASIDSGIAYIGPVSSLEDRPWRVAYNGDSNSPVFRMAQCVLLGDETGWEYEYIAPDEVGLPEDPSDSDCSYYVERTWQILREQDGRLYMTESQVWHQSTGIWSDPDDEAEWVKSSHADSIRYWSYLGEPEL